MKKRIASALAAVSCLAIMFAVFNASALAHGHEHHRGQHNGRGYVSGLDEHWLTASLQGDLFEISGGNIAQTQAENQEVKALGQRLVKDHSESFQEGSNLAKKLGIEVPTQPGFL